LVLKQSTLGEHSIDLNQQLAYSQLSVDQLVHGSKISGLSTEMSIKCRLSVNQGVDKYQSRVLIDTRPQMPIVHMIHLLFA